MSVKGRIVVIDDEVNAAAALETLLKEDGYEVAKAHDARTGLQELEKVEPGARSIETAARIQKLSREIGVLRLSAVVNKTGGRDDLDTISARLNELGIPVIGAIPYDDALIRADMSGRAPFDLGGDAVSAIRRISDAIMASADSD